MNNNLYVLLIFLFCFFVLLLSQIYKKNKSLLGIIIISLYFIISIGCFITLNNNERVYIELSLWPFIYFIIIFAIQCFPFYRDYHLANKFIVKNTKAINIFADIFLIISILYVILFFNKVVNNLISGEWLYTYIEVHEDNVVLYNNLYERIVLNFVSYVKLPMLIYAFYAYSHRIQYKRGIMLLIMPFIVSLMGSISSASRAGLFLVALQYLSCYVVFYKFFNTKFKKTLTLLLFAFIAIALTVALSITWSRFGEENNSWLGSYFGNSYFTAHNLIRNTIQYSNGSYFFGGICELFGIPKQNAICSIDNGLAFTTLIGVRFSDFGFIGTIIYAFIGMGLVDFLTRRRTIDLGDIFIILYYYQNIAIGVFYDNANVLSWIAVLIISVFLKQLSNKSNKSYQHTYE